MRAAILGLTPLHFAAVAASVATVPLLFIPSFTRLSWLSLLGCISTVLVTLTVLAAVGLDPTRERMPVQVRRFSMRHPQPNHASGGFSCDRLEWTALTRECESTPVYHGVSGAATCGAQHRALAGDPAERGNLCCVGVRPQQPSCAAHQHAAAQGALSP